NLYRAVYINSLGKIYAYNSSLESWDYIETLSFFQIEFPEELTVFSDGFYQTNLNTGVVTSGNLGDGTLEHFALEVINSEAYYYNLDVEVFDPHQALAVFQGTLDNIWPGDPNIRIIEIDQSQPEVAPDTSPSLEAIETVA